MDGAIAPPRDVNIARSQSPSNSRRVQGASARRTTPDPPRRAGARRGQRRSVTPAAPRMVEGAAQGDRVQDANHRRVQVSDPAVHRQAYDPAAAPNPAMQNAATRPGGGGPARAPSSDRRPAGQQDDKGKGKGDKGKGKGQKKGGKDRGKGRKGGDRAPKGAGKRTLNVNANARAQRSPGRTEQQHRAASPRNSGGGQPPINRGRGGGDRSRTQSPRHR